MAGKIYVCKVLLRSLNSCVNLHAYLLNEFQIVCKPNWNGTENSNFIHHFVELPYRIYALVCVT